MQRRGRIAVIGVGNEFRRDDGVGWAGLARLGGRPLPPDTDLATCDGAPGRLMGRWEGARLAVVVDAAHAHPGDPGRVHRLGLGEAVELARVLGRLPQRLVVYAVEGADSTLGTGPSPAVAEAVEPLVTAITDEIAQETREAARRPA